MAVIIVRHGFLCNNADWQFEIIIRNKVNEHVDT